MSTPARRLAAIMVADVVGFSKRMERDDAGTLARIRAMRADVVDPAIASVDGRVVKTTGDGFLAEFASADAALRCAVRVQRELALRNASAHDDERIELRVGINLGDVIVEGDDIFGDGVNVAARLEGLAPPGGICVSQAVRDQVHGAIDVQFVDAGEQYVKNIERAIRCYSVTLEAEPRRQRAAAGRAPRPMSIGILPFAPWSEDEAAQRRARSITRDFTAMLARCGTLISVKPVAEGRAADVRYLVEGGVDGSDVTTVDVHLVDAATGEELWSEAVSLPHADGKMHGQRLHAVAWHLVRALVGAEVRRVTTLPEPPSTPLELVLQAIALERTELDIPQRMRAKEALLEEALRRDPNCVPALLNLAVATVLRLNLDIDADRTTLVRRMDELTAKALGLHDTRPTTWLLRSTALMYNDRWQASLEASAKAIALEPYSSDLLGHHAWLTLLCGRPAESLRILEQSMAMDPQRTASPMQVTCEAQLLLGRYGESIAAGESALGLGASDDFATQLRLAAAYANAGDVAKAQATKDLVLRLQPRYTIAIHRARQVSRHPEYVARLEQHLYPGLRAAGLPEP